MTGRDSPGHLVAPSYTVVSMAIWTRWITCPVIFRWRSNPLLGPWWEYEEIDWSNGKTSHGLRNDYNGVMNDSEPREPREPQEPREPRDPNPVIGQAAVQCI